MYEVNGADLSSVELDGLEQANKARWVSVDYDVLLSLRYKGLVKFHGDRQGIRDAEVTLKGRSFLKDAAILKRNEIIRTYLPVLVSALLGLISTIIGTVVGAYITGWRP